jgi:hypothetical protein
MGPFWALREPAHLTNARHAAYQQNSQHAQAYMSTSCLLSSLWCSIVSWGFGGEVECLSACRPFPLGGGPRAAPQRKLGYEL